MRINPLEFGPPIRELFVGRAKELAILQQEFSDPAPKAVCIAGTAGVGKTSLALVFAELNRQAFPSGVYNVHATPLETLGETVDREVHRSIRPYLIIVDELDARPRLSIEPELSSLRNRHPNARVLATSRLPLSASGMFELALGNLSQAEFRELLEKRVAHSEPEFADRLYSALMGHPLAANLAADLLREGVTTPRQLLQRLQAFTWSGVFDITGRRLSETAPEHKRIRTDIVAASGIFLRKLNDDPKLLYQLTSREFEQLVAELLRRLGYEIILTPASKDGGKDIYAAKKDHLGTFLYIVECKKYAPGHPVGVGWVRQLNGVVQAEQATAGILATTSFFTRDAQEFQKTIAFQISLKDYFGIQEWLQSAIVK